MTLEQQKRELRADLADVTSDRATATAEFTRLVELERNGNRQARPLIAQTRGQLDALDVRETEINTALSGIETRLGEAAWIEGRAQNLGREFDLNGAQVGEIERMLKDGKPLAAARSWALAQQQKQVAETRGEFAFNSKDGVAW